MGSSGIGSEIQSDRTECQGRFFDRREAGLLLLIAIVSSRTYFLISFFMIFLSLRSKTNKYKFGVSPEISIDFISESI